MAEKKSDIYSSLWASCDELRGGMDKDYVLFMQAALKERLNGKTVNKERVPGLIEQLDALACEKYP